MVPGSEVWVQSLVGELRLHMLCTQAWSKIKAKQSNTLFSYASPDTPYSLIQLSFYFLACVSYEAALSCQLMLDFVFHVLGGLTVFRTLCPGVKHIWISLVAQMVKCLPAIQETWVRSLGWEDPRRRKWQPTPILLPGKPHGWRSLAGYSPWVAKSQARLSNFTKAY